jgi:hypothetical protein
MARARKFSRERSRPPCSGSELGEDYGFFGMKGCDGVEVPNLRPQEAGSAREHSAGGLTVRRNEIAAVRL